MLSFYPGPSKVYPASLDFIKEAYELGIPSINHRSVRFNELMGSIQTTVKKQWNLPKDYQIAFTSSATESWEIFIQSFGQGKGFHLKDGAFGEKWANYAKNIHPNLQILDWDQGLESLNNCSDTDTICMTHSETSMGLMRVPNRSYFGKALVGVDATSSMGGMELPWDQADFWLGSVQKCMGMPAGLGVIIYNNRCIERAKEQKYYNDFSWIEENRKKNETPHTPNVLMIYVFSRLLETLAPLKEIHQETLRKSALMEDFFQKRWSYLVEKPDNRLPTVHTIEYPSNFLSEFLSKLESKSIILGKGYGKWKDTSFRVANFPAHTEEDLNQLFAEITRTLNG